MNMKNPAILTAGAFLAAWGASNFALDYRSILWAVLAGAPLDSERQQDVGLNVGLQIM